MGKNIYTGVGGTARKVKKIYLGVGDKARKVKKIYIGVEGAARQCWASAFDFSYTGNYKFSGNPDGDWAISFLSSGTLTIRSAPTPIDVFCCAGGLSGGNGSDWNGYGGTHYDGGNGGRGGKCNTITGVKITEGSQNITVGGAGADSSAFGVSANAGSHGAAAGGVHREFDGTSGGAGDYAFYESTFAAPSFGAGYRFGAGGGGGASGWRKDSGEEPHGSPGYGGASGGGTGAQYYAGSGYAKSGAANSGGGGGGGCGPYHPNGAGGGSGVVIIRNARK